MAASSRQEQEHTGLQLPINSVKSLLLNPFERRTLGEKLCVKELGPEKPGLNLTQQTQEKGKTYQRSFSLNWYDRKAWLTGCFANAVFCFPCLLFKMQGTDTTWTVTGDLKHFLIVIRLSWVGSRGEQLKPGAPDFPFPGHIDQL